MICQKVAVGLVLIRQCYLPAKDASKMAVVVFLRLILTQSRREKNGIIIGRNGYEPLVECLIVEGRQADAIAGIKAVFFVRLVGPGDDVASQQ